MATETFSLEEYYDMAAKISEAFTVCQGDGSLDTTV